MFKIFLIVIFLIVIFRFLLQSKNENFNNFSTYSFIDENKNSFAPNFDYKIYGYKKIGKNFFIDQKNKNPTPIIYTKDTFKPIRIDNEILNDYKNIRIYLLKKFNDTLIKNKFKEVDNKLTGVMKNDYCLKFIFYIIIKNQVEYLQIQCIIIKDYLNIYFDSIDLYGSSLNFNQNIKPFNHKIFNNFEPLLPDKNIYPKKLNHDPFHFDNNKKTILKNIKNKHKFPEYFGAYEYSCNSADNIDKKFISNKFFCTLFNKSSTKKKFWDKPCKYNTDCPFYKKNKNYENNRGGCIKGYCEMPLNIKRISYTLYDKNTKPYCYNCNNYLHKECCDDQKNRELYPNLNSPDYAF